MYVRFEGKNPNVPGTTLYSLLRNLQVSPSSKATLTFVAYHCGRITRRQILDSSKLKEFADDNFRFDENGSKLSKRVENIVGKGEIARYKQFLLFPQCFQKACFPGASKGVIVCEWVKEKYHWEAFHR